MTLNDLQRAALVLFAAREASHTGSLHAMKAICFVVRNRVRAGWYDGNWMDVIEHAHESAANTVPPPILDLRSRSLQVLTRDIDGIFYGTAGEEMEVAFGSPQQKGTRPALYYQFLDMPVNEWFRENVLGNREAHPIRARLHPIIFFE